MKKSRLLGAVCVLMFAQTNQVLAGLNEGDILVTEWQTNSILQVDPVSGAQTVLSSG